jgi:hypothetical protein
MNLQTVGYWTVIMIRSHYTNTTAQYMTSLHTPLIRDNPLRPQYSMTRGLGAQHCSIAHGTYLKVLFTNSCSEVIIGHHPTLTERWSVTLQQCCATFLHSRHTKYCRRVMAAHQPHFAYCGGGDGLWHWLAATTSYKSTPTKKMFYLMFIIIHLYYYVIYFKYIHYLK